MKHKNRHHHHHAAPPGPVLRDASTDVVSTPSHSSSSGASCPPPLRLFSDASNLLRHEKRRPSDTSDKPRIADADLFLVNDSAGQDTSTASSISEAMQQIEAERSLRGSSSCMVSEGRKRSRQRRMSAQVDASENDGWGDAGTADKREASLMLRIVPPPAMCPASAPLSSSTTAAAVHLDAMRGHVAETAAVAEHMSSGGGQPSETSRAPTQAFSRSSATRSGAWRTAAVTLAGAGTTTTTTTTTTTSATAVRSTGKRASSNSVSKTSTERSRLSIPRQETTCFQVPPSAAAAAHAASRVLFLYEADEESSRTNHTNHNDDGFNASQPSRGDSVSSRSPSAASCNTAAPETRKESFLLELLTRASSTEAVGAAGTAEEDAPPSQMHAWLRSPVTLMAKANMGSINARPVTANVCAAATELTPLKDTQTVTTRKDPAGEVLTDPSACFPEAEWVGGEVDASANTYYTATTQPQAGRAAVNFTEEKEAKSSASRECKDSRSSCAEDQPTSLFRLLGSPAKLSDTPTPQLPQQQQPPAPHLLTSISSPIDALRYSFPSMSLNLSTADIVTGGGARLRHASRGASPSVPRSLFSDAHACADELPESDRISLATTASTAERGFGGTITLDTPAEGLDMSSFRTPLSPCPSSVAPPFSVFPCAATSRVTSPVSIPAKMMKQRQREHARVRNGSASPASHVTHLASGFSSYPTTTNSNTNTNVHSGSSNGGNAHLYASQHNLRESFSSLGMASAASGSLFSVSPSVVDSGSRYLAEAEQPLERSDPLMTTSAARVHHPTTPSASLPSVFRMTDDTQGEARSLPHFRDACPSFQGVGEGGAGNYLEGDVTSSSVPLSPAAVPAAASADVTSNTVVGTSSAFSARRAAAASLRIRLPQSGTSTPPQLSPRATPCEASLPRVGSPSIGHRSVDDSLHISTSPSELSVRAGTAARVSGCCASPWSPMSTKSVHAQAGISAVASAPSVTSVSPLSTTVHHGNTCMEAHPWSTRYTATGTTSSTRSCSPPLPVSRSTAFVSGAGALHSTNSFPHDSGARTPPRARVRSSASAASSSVSAGNVHNFSFTPRHGSGGSRGSSVIRPVSSSPLFPDLERRDGGSAMLHVDPALKPGVSGRRQGEERISPAAGIEATGQTTKAETARAVYACSSSSQPRLHLYSSVEYEPLTFAAPGGRRVDSSVDGGGGREASSPGFASTFSTPPPSASLSILTSKAVSPCEAADQHAAATAAGGWPNVTFSHPVDNCARSRRRSPLHDAAAAPVARTTALMSRMSRTVAAPRRTGRHFSPGGSPPVPWHTSTLAGGALESEQPHVASISDTSPLSAQVEPSRFSQEKGADASELVGRLCYGVESELCGLQPTDRNSEGRDETARADGGHVSTPSVAGEKASPLRSRVDGGLQQPREASTACGVRDVSGRTDAQDKFHALLTTREHNEKAHRLSGSSSSNRSSSATAHDEESADHTRAVGAQLHEAWRVSSRPSTSLQLVPPPPLVALPRSVSSGTTTPFSPPFSPSCPAPLPSRQSPMPALSRRTSPLTMHVLDDAGADGDNDGAEELPGTLAPLFRRLSAQLSHTLVHYEHDPDVDSPTVLPHQELTREEEEDEERGEWDSCERDFHDADPFRTQSAREGVIGAEYHRDAPASAFHYAFSSLRGARSKQEDSVTLTPDLMIREAVRQARKPDVELRNSEATRVGETFADRGSRSGARRETAEQHKESSGSLGRVDVQEAAPVAFTCFGVFDGHCGDTISSLASQYFPEHFEFAVREYWAQWAEERAQKREAQVNEGAPQQQQQQPQFSSSDSNLRDSSDDKINTNIFKGVENKAVEVSAGQGSDNTSVATLAESKATPAEFQRVISAALVQSLVHLDLTLYDAIHQKTHGRAFSNTTQRKDAGSTASVATFFKVPSTYAASSKAAADTTNASRGSIRKTEGASKSDDLPSVTVDDESNVEASAEETYRLCIANLGDSRAIIGNRHTGQLLLSTTDHRISACPSEGTRIAAVGGVVELGRVDGSLDVTRGLGDYRYKVEPAQWWSKAKNMASTKASAAAATREGEGEKQAMAIAAGSTCVTATALTNVFATTTEFTASTGSADAESCVTTARRSGTLTSQDAGTPMGDALSAARALQWHSGSTTPVRSSAEKVVSEEDDNEQNVDDVSNSRHRSETNNANCSHRNHNNHSCLGTLVAVDVDGGEGGDEGSRASSNTGDVQETQPTHHGRLSNQWRSSILNSAPLTMHTHDAATTVPPLKHEETERTLFNHAATTTFVKTPRVSPSPPSRSSPASPKHLTSALTGNAVSNIADVYEWEVHRDDVLIMASDGVWDSMTSEEVLEFVCRELQALEMTEEEEGRAGTNEFDTASQLFSNVVCVPGGETLGQRRTGENGFSGMNKGDVGAGASAITAAAVEATASSFRPSHAEHTPTVSTTTTTNDTLHDSNTPCAGTPVQRPLDAHALHAPPRQPTSQRHAKVLCTPCGDGGGCCDLDGTPGRASSGSVARSSAVQTAARRLTEHVVNTLSGNDNTTVIVVVFQ